jgi:hypothetical protein
MAPEVLAKCPRPVMERGKISVTIIASTGRRRPGGNTAENFGPGTATTPQWMGTPGAAAAHPRDQPRRSAHKRRVALGLTLGDFPISHGGGTAVV